MSCFQLDVKSGAQLSLSSASQTPMPQGALAKRFRIQMPVGSGLNEANLVSVRLLGALIHSGAFQSPGRGDRKQRIQDSADQGSSPHVAGLELGRA